MPLKKMFIKMCFQSFPAADRPHATPPPFCVYDVIIIVRHIILLYLLPESQV